MCFLCVRIESIRETSNVEASIVRLTRCEQGDTMEEGQKSAAGWRVNS